MRLEEAERCPILCNKTLDHESLWNDNDRKGWDGLDQDFLFRVDEDMMQSGTVETRGGRSMS